MVLVVVDVTLVMRWLEGQVDGCYTEPPPPKAVLRVVPVRFVGGGSVLYSQKFLSYHIVKPR